MTAPARKPALRTRLVRAVRARLRFWIVLLSESGITLAFFGLLAVVSGLLIIHFHEAARGHPLSEGVYAAISMMFLQPTLPYPQGGPVQILFFLLPVLGIALLAEPVVRFCALVFNQENRLEDWQVALASTYSDHYVVCGLGAIGYRVVRYLERLGKGIVAVEIDPANRFIKEIRDSGIPVVIGDPRQETLLREVGVERCQAILAVTNNDLANLEIVLDARQLKPDVRVVLRMFDDSLAAKLQHAFNIRVAFSSSSLAGPAFAAASTSLAVRQSFQVADDIYHIGEFKAGTVLNGLTVSELERRYPCSVLAVVHEGAQAVFPQAAQPLSRGDTLTVAAALETIKAMEKAIQ